MVLLDLTLSTNSTSIIVIPLGSTWRNKIITRKHRNYLNRRSISKAISTNRSSKKSAKKVTTRCSYLIGEISSSRKYLISLFSQSSSSNQISSKLSTLKMNFENQTHRFSYPKSILINCYHLQCALSIQITMTQHCNRRSLL